MRNSLTKWFGLLAALLTLLSFSACSKKPEAGNQPAKPTEIKNQTYRMIGGRSVVAIVSSDELEIRQGGENLVCKYTMQDNKMRVIVNALGTTTAKYFDLTPQGLVDEDGDIFYEPETFQKITAQIQLNTQLMAAVEKGNSIEIDALVRKGADVNAKDSKGQPLLWCSLEQGDQTSADVLVALGADYTVANNSGDTPLWYAAKRGYRDIAKSIGEKAAEKGLDAGARYILLRMREIQDKDLYKSGLPLAEYALLLQAISSFDWPAASNALGQLKVNIAKLKCSASGEEKSFSIRHDVLEIYGALEQYSRWHTSLLQTYANDIVSNLSANSIYFGGTDSGRFVITAFQRGQKLPFHVITQNALADNIYLDYIRGQMGDEIVLPSLEDSNEAFLKYGEDVKAGRVKAGANVKIENGKVSAQDVASVMAVNGILAELIFKENKDKHDFYVEESHVINWMYPYLQPVGLVMKLNSEPIDVTTEIASEDRQYWDAYVARLRSNIGFARDESAQKAYSKLRCAIAGIYDFRRMYDEAEYAYKQAVDIYPLGPEANFRLAQMYMSTKRVEDAEQLIRNYAVANPQNDTARNFLAQINNLRKMNFRRQEIEKKQEVESVTADEALELVSIYRASGMTNVYQEYAMRMLSDTNMPPPHILALAGLFAQDQRVDVLISTLEQYTKRVTDNLDVWLDLAAAYAFVRRDSEAINASRKAIDLGGEKARAAILRDKRFQELTANSEFRALFPPQITQPTNAEP